MAIPQVHHMRPYFLATALIATLCLAAPAFAQEAATPQSVNLVNVSDEDSAEGDDIVRLPGQGQVKKGDRRTRHAAGRLLPGGGLVMSFDTDDNGRVTPEELRSGAISAFAVADTNQDGRLSALEQQDWAHSLPTRDDTLANPVRFDPNLDRVVSEREFVAVVAQLATTYADADGNIYAAKLEAPEPKASDNKRQWSDLEEPDIFARVD